MYPLTDLEELDKRLKDLEKLVSRLEDRRTLPIYIQVGPDEIAFLEELIKVKETGMPTLEIPLEDSTVFSRGLGEYRRLGIPKHVMGTLLKKGGQS